MPLLSSFPSGRVLRKPLFCGIEPVECRRKSCVDGHLHDDFDDFFPRAADVQCAADVYLQLSGCVAEGRQGRDDGNLAGT